MADVFRELVTGSRLYGDLATIRTVLVEIQAGRPAGSMVLVHGACPPRHPETKRPIPWATAEKLPPLERSFFRGADWLAAWVAVELGWQVEAHPAQWGAPCRPSCDHGARRKNRYGSYCPAAGEYRNEAMAASGVRRCDGFLLPCRNPDCHRPRPHGTHGTSNCLEAAAKAGVYTERHVG